MGSYPRKLQGILTRTIKSMATKKKKKLTKVALLKADVKTLTDLLAKSRDKENEYLTVLQKRDEFIERLVKLVFPHADSERYGWMQRERKDGDRAYDEVVRLIAYRQMNEGAIRPERDTIERLTDIIRWQINPKTTRREPSPLEIRGEPRR